MTPLFLTKKINLSINYLTNSIREDGSFIYEIHAKKCTRSTSYNILRHAGTVYILYQWYQIYGPDKLYIEKFNLACAFLKNQIKRLEVGSELLCVVENGSAKLGGAALTLLALVEHFKIERSEEDLIIMRALAGFIVNMQEKSGKFKSKISYPERNLFDFESTYYPGEAVLALINFYKITQDVTYINAAKLGIDYLILHPVTNRQGMHMHNHWLATALSEMSFEIVEPTMLKELWYIEKATLQSLVRNFNPQTNQFNYSSAELATRGETLLAALKLKRILGLFSNTHYLQFSLIRIIEQLISLQVSKNSFCGEVKLKGGIKKAERKSLIRIDFVQHSLQVMIGFSEILKEEPIKHNDLKSMSTKITKPLI